MAMIVSLQRRLDDRSLDEIRERSFFSHSLQYLKTTSGRQIEVHDWMITSYEVEFGDEIGAGGLYVIYYSSYVLPYDPNNVSSSKVFQGTWNKTHVALKVLRTDSGITPSSGVCKSYSRRPSLVTKSLPGDLSRGGCKVF
jgi:hypothetical protein